MAKAKGWIMAGILAGNGFIVAAQETEGAAGWQRFTDVRLGAGYKDNVTLASSDPEASPFLRAEIDAMVWRNLGEASEFEGFVFGEHRQYLDSQQVDMEQTLFTLLRLRQDWSDSWQSGAALEYFYQDQVVDVSATEAEPERARVQGNTFAGRPELKRRLGGGWLAVELAGTRQLFEEVIDDYWEVAPGVRWTWPVLREAELDLSYQYAQAWFDRDEARSADGVPIPGTHREAGRHQAALTARQYLGEGRRWRMTLKVSGRINRDHANGYYDYVRPQVSLRLRYRQGPWEIEGGARANHYDYRVQTAGVDDPGLRRRSEVYCDLLVQRRLAKFLWLFAEYRYERTFANRAVEEYAVNAVSGGVSLEF